MLIARGDWRAGRPCRKREGAARHLGACSAARNLGSCFGHNGGSHASLPGTADGPPIDRRQVAGSPLRDNAPVRTAKDFPGNTWLLS